MKHILCSLALLIAVTHTLAEERIEQVQDLILDLDADHGVTAAKGDIQVNPQSNPPNMTVGQERDAAEHPGIESFDGRIARLLVFARPLEDAKQKTLLISMRARYGISESDERKQKPTPGDAAKAQIHANWPFDADEAVRRQKEAARTIEQPIVLETPLTERGGPVLTWRLIPAGKFMMGSPSREPGHEGDERLHAETISEPFYMLETQLTVEQYRAVMGDDPTDGSEAGDPKVPAGITYRDTVDKVLPALAKHAPDGWKVILPDQTRLEYAARAGVATRNHGGDKPEDAAPLAWTRENSDGKVHPVARKRPNAWGLHDVIGNRWHWFWRAGDGYGDASTNDHIVYGGSYNAESGGNGARLANIMISNKSEGARFALIRMNATLPKGHPETARKRR